MPQKANNSLGRLSRTAQIFIDLVRIDSPSGQEEKMIAYLKPWLKKNGFEYSVDQYNNLLGYRAGKGESILLCAHMDTVEPGRGIKPVIKKDIVCSSGKTILGADNKAPLSAILTAVEEYLKNETSPRTIELLFTAKEETGGGVEFFDFTKLRSKYGIISDYAKPIGGIAVASPFIYNFEAKFIGKAAHASRPEEGINSLVVALKFASQVQVGRMDENKTTINIGKIVSGTSINTVPEETIINGEVRSFSEDRFKQHLVEIERLARNAAKGTKVKLRFSKDGYCSGYSYRQDDELVRKIVAIYKQMGFETSYLITTGISDSNPLVGAGIKVVTLTDGVDKAHTNQENISLKNIDTLHNLFLNLLNLI